MAVTVYLAADHRGYSVKERLEAYLAERGVTTVDLTPSFTAGDDYPVIAAGLVAAMRKSPDARGILSCGSGAGIAIAANRFRGIRAAVGLGASHVAIARHDDDINVLVIAADFAEDHAVRAMADALVDAPFASGEARFVRRIAELDELGS